jgi:hypothetical protein
MRIKRIPQPAEYTVELSWQQLVDIRQFLAKAEAYAAAGAYLSRTTLSSIDTFLTVTGEVLEGEHD